MFSGKLATLTDANALGASTDFTATIDWGDGTPGSVGTVTGGGGAYSVDGSHRYATGGSYTITVHIVDDGGSTATATLTATIRLAQTTPRLSRLRVDPNAFPAATRGPTITSVPATGATIGYHDTLAARTTFRVFRCARAAGPCRQRVLVGSFSHTDHAGDNRLHFSGRLRGRALILGRYVLQATARLGGKTSNTDTTGFVIRS
jgi:hypothetical protein